MGVDTSLSNTSTRTGSRIHSGDVAIKARPRIGLGLRIFLATALVVIVALGGALYLTKLKADRAADESIGKALDATQSAIEDALASRGHTLQQVAIRLAQVPTYVSRLDEALRTGDRSNLLDQADEFKSQLGAGWALITDAQGNLKAWTRDRDRMDEPLGEGALVGIALGGEPTTGIWIEPTPSGDSLYQAVGVPILSPGGTVPTGVLVAAVPIDNDFVARLRRQTNSEVLFIAPDTLGVPQVAASTLAPELLGGAVRQLHGDSMASSESAGRRVRIETGSGTWEGVTGPLLTAGGETVGEYVGLRSRDIELAAYAKLQQAIGIAFGVGLLLALLSSILVARRITRPVHQLVEATRQVSDGQYAVEVEVRSRDEIGELASAFRRMLADLKEKQQLVDYLSVSARSTLAVARPSMAAALDLPETAIRAAPAGTGLLARGVLFANRYQIIDVLGMGGMGVVYRAVDRELDETVAIKTLRREMLLAEESSLERFKQEIRLARRITHRNVVRTHDLGEVDGIYFITMEYVEGTSVEQLIRKRGKLPPGVTLTIGKQLCRALEVAHEQGVIHRDIKPQNLVVDAGGLLKVMDFGIARLAEGHRPAGDGLTGVGVMIGTPQYMAPEQLAGEEVDGRTDLYAAGAVLFECVTGQPVFSGSAFATLMLQHLQEVPENPTSLNPEVPDALAQVILRALAKRKGDRWQSADEMHQALDRVSV